MMTTMQELRVLAKTDDVAKRELIKRCRAGMLVPYWEESRK